MVSFFLRAGLGPGVIPAGEGDYSLFTRHASLGLSNVTAREEKAKQSQLRMRNGCIMVRYIVTLSFAKNSLTVKSFAIFTAPQ